MPLGTPGFNPHARKGRGPSLGKGIASIISFISIHAPAKGAASFYALKSRIIHVSTHAPAKDAAKPVSNYPRNYPLTYNRS
jgi:hypothetical protein